MRKIAATGALTLAALGLTAGAASASESDVQNNANEHANTGDGINVVISDVLTNANVLGDGVLTDGVNVGDVDAL